MAFDIEGFMKACPESLKLPSLKQGFRVSPRVLLATP
jgi:hypothetical protein